MSYAANCSRRNKMKTCRLCSRVAKGEFQSRILLDRNLNAKYVRNLKMDGLHNTASINS
jgi:hypothetical protein